MQTIDKSAVEIKQEFKQQFSTSISQDIKQFNKKRFILAVEGIVSLIIPAVMAYIFFVLEHPVTPKDTNTAIAAILICGSILPIISLYYYFCPEKIKEEELAAQNLLKMNNAFNKALYQHGEQCSKQTTQLEEQILALFRIKKNNFLSTLKQAQLIDKLKSTFIFPKFDKIGKFDARITLGGICLVNDKNNDIGTKYQASRNGCVVSMRENVFYSLKPNDYYMVLLLGGFVLLTVTNCMLTYISQMLIIIGYIFSITLLFSYIVMIFVNSADQYKGVVLEIETPEKIYDGHAILLESNDKYKIQIKKALREVRSDVSNYDLFISKTNPPKTLSPVFYSLLEQIKNNFKPKYMRVSIKNNNMIIFLKTSSKRLNIFDWTKNMENSKAYEPFINRLLSVFNMADYLSKKPKA